jgi:hypothetical protein
MFAATESLNSTTSCGAAPGRPDERDRLARRNADVEGVERLVAAQVLEAHLFEADLAPDRRALHRVGHVGRLLVGVEHLEHRREGHARLAERGIQIDDLLHRREHTANVAEEGEQRADGELAAHDEESTETEHDDARCELGDAGGDGGARVHVHAALDAGECPADAAHETVLLVALAREGADRAHAVQALCVPRPEPLPEGVLHAFAATLLARREGGDERGDGEETEDGDGDRTVEPRHAPPGECHVHERGHELERHVREGARRLRRAGVDRVAEAARPDLILGA